MTTSDNNKQAEADAISLETLTTAEKVIDVTFTAEEQELMLDAVNKRVDDYRAIRRVKLDNAMAPPLYFDPRLPGTRFRSDKDTEPARKYRISQTPEVSRPSNLDDLAFYPVTHLAELIRTQQVKSVELTEMYIERIMRYDPHLECIITLTTDLAIQQARRADEEISQGQYRSPLHGIPWGAKDLIAVKGYPTTWGASPFKNQRFEKDATVVQRLEEAGAVLVAKVVSGELAYGDKWFGGMTKNPWNLEEGSGGSSAGPAASVGGGLVGFALGTETTGSIVWPALRCGTVGLRPTFGLVSRHGVMALSWTLDKVGPVARSVEDCALILTAIAGSDSNDGYTIDEAFNWNPDLDVSQMKIGYVEEEFRDSMTEPDHEHETVSPLKKMGIDLREHKANDRRTLELLRSLGFDLVPIKLPETDLDSLLLILSVEGAAAFDELTRTNQDDLLVGQDENAHPNRFRQARFIPAVEYIQANRIRMQLMESMAKIMQTVDVLIMPQLGANNLTLTNLTGQPTIGVPNGFTDEGMPTGINFIGNVFREAELLAVARIYQDATDFHMKHPDMAYDSR